MEFVNIKEKKIYHLLDWQNEEMWEKGYLTVFELGSRWVAYKKMEDLRPTYTDKDIRWIERDIPEENNYTNQSFNRNCSADASQSG